MQDFWIWADPKHEDGEANGLYDRGFHELFLKIGLVIKHDGTNNKQINGKMVWFGKVCL